jgi:hypothetical protein
VVEQQHDGDRMDIAAENDAAQLHHPYLQEYNDTLPANLAPYNLQANAQKSEWYTISRGEWQANATTKLGDKIGTTAEIAHKRGRAIQAFRKMSRTWTVLRTHRTPLHIRLRLYNAFVLPHLTYNLGALALTPRQMTKLDTIHRRQLRLLCGIFWNEHHQERTKELYRRTSSEPRSTTAARQRWHLLGSILRIAYDKPALPAFLTMERYFSERQDVPKHTGGRRVTLPALIQDDLYYISPAISFRTLGDLYHIRDLAQSAPQWTSLGDQIAEAKTREQSQKTPISLIRKRGRDEIQANTRRQRSRRPPTNRSMNDVRGELQRLYIIR